MLQSGNDRVPPAHSMWPLFCNEVGLSYDQEERVRNYQRTLLQTPESWLDRHTGRASGLAMQSLHDGINCVAGRMRQRERSLLRGLTAEQQLKFLSWAEKNESRIKTKLAEKKAKTAKAPKKEKYETSDKHHIAANLYILNNRLQEMIASFPKTYPMVSAAYLKRLARRPSFESLGHQKEEGAARGLSRDGSFASSGSLKRVSSSLSMEDQDKPQPQQVSPEDGQEASRAAVEKELGFVKDIIPPYTPPTVPQVQPVAVPPVPIPSPTPVENTSSYHQYAVPPPTAQAPIAGAPPHPGHTAMHYAPHPGAQPVVYAAAQVSHYPPVVQYQQHQIPVQHHVHQPRAPPPAMHAAQPPQYYPPPPQVSGQPPHHHPPPIQMPANQAPPPAPQATMSPAGAPPPAAPAPAVRTHGRASSFLPPHLNVVPEEMFPTGESAEEIFMSLMDEDWAIGEGVDMDTAA